MEHPVLGHHPIFRTQLREVEVGVGAAQIHLHLGMVLPPSAPLRIGLGAQPEPRLPEELAAGEAEVVEASHPDQILHRGALQRRRGPAQEVEEGAVRPVPVPFGDDALGDLLPPPPHEPQADAEILPLGGAADPAPVHVWQEGGDAVPPRVPAQGVQGVEAHGLIVEERHVVLGGVVVPEPRRLVRQEPEGGGVGLGEAELGEGHHLEVDLVSGLLVHPVS